MDRRALGAGALLVAFIAILVALAGAPGRARAGDGGASAAPVVVELFTSQSCYSCPPAEALLGELSARPGLIALEWHVDYWNRLVYGSRGRWADPYSDAAFTERQRLYNQALRGTNGVYTPQMVVNGRAEMVGSRRHAVEQALAAARTPLPLALTVVAGADGGPSMVVATRPPASPVPLWRVRYLDQRVTEVVRGENAGKRLVNHHIVRGLDRLGTLGPTVTRVPLPSGLAPGEGCAVLAQAAATGPILGAVACAGTGAAS